MPETPAGTARDNRTWVVLAVAGPPVLLAVAGLVHPAQLDQQTAQTWTVLHLVLLPVFPLLALGPWLAGRGGPRWWRWTTAVLGYVYAVFYGALDVLAGVGTGVLLRVAPAGLPTLFQTGNTLSYVGVAAYLVAAVGVCGQLIRRTGWRAVGGSVLVTLGALSFLTSHIYWPYGVLTMGLLAGGWTWLVLADRVPVD